MGLGGRMGEEMARLYLPTFADVFPPVTDAYCLLDVYTTLSADPASFGLPANLRGACVNGSGVQLERPQKSRDKKQKKAAAVQDQVRRV